MSREIDAHRSDVRCSKDRRPQRRPASGPGLRGVIERNAATWYLGSLCATFLAGFSTYHYVQEASGVEVVSKTEREQSASSIVDLRAALAKAIAQRDLVLEELGKAQSGAETVSCPNTSADERARPRKKSSGLPVDGSARAD
jgi:hypothetical protein